MKAISALVNKISQAMYILSGLTLVLMVLVTMADIVTRTLFSASNGKLDFTFVGGIEIVSYCLLIMLFFSFPNNVEKSQIIVDIFTEKMNPKLKKFIDGFYLLGFTVLGLIMSYKFCHVAFEAKDNGVTTQDLLIPLFYFYFIACFATAILCLKSLFISFENMRSFGDVNE